MNFALRAKKYIEGLTFTYYQSTLCLIVQGKDTYVWFNRVFFYYIRILKKFYFIINNTGWKHSHTESKVTTVKKLIDEKLLKILQEDLYGKWSDDLSSGGSEDDEELELNGKEQTKIERIKKKLMEDTADFIRSWNPKGTGLNRKLERKSRIQPKRNIDKSAETAEIQELTKEPCQTKPRYESASSIEERSTALSDNN